MSELSNVGSFYQYTNTREMSLVDPENSDDPEGSPRTILPLIQSFVTSGTSRRPSPPSELVCTDAEQSGRVEVGFDQDQDRVDVRFNPEQIDCICNILQQRRSLDDLTRFLGSLTPAELLRDGEELAKARALVSYHQGDFAQLFSILAGHSFEHSSHAQLQQLWYKAHYAEAQKVRGRPLGAVDKYRLRRKHPLPETIWDGEETVYCFKEKSRQALKMSFVANRYPTPEEKKVLY